MNKYCRWHPVWGRVKFIPHPAHHHHGLLGAIIPNPSMETFLRDMSVFHTSISHPLSIVVELRYVRYIYIISEFWWFSNEAKQLRSADELRSLIFLKSYVVLFNAILKPSNESTHKHNEISTCKNLFHRSYARHQTFQQTQNQTFRLFSCSSRFAC